MGTIEFIIQKENSECNQEIALQNVPLSNHEQEVIYRGFIVYFLKKKYLQLSKSEKLRQTALAAVQLLNSFTFVKTNQTLSFFSHHWTGLISTGGLIKKNSNYFCLSEGLGRSYVAHRTFTLSRNTMVRI